MVSKRQVEVFSAGCVACDEVVDLVRRVACSSCEVHVRDMHDPNIASKARALGVVKVPTVVVDSTLAPCCIGPAVDEAGLRSAGVGQPAG